MNNTYIVLGTKGGTGKSIVATMDLSLLFADRDKQVTVDLHDDHNSLELKSNFDEKYSVESSAENIQQFYSRQRLSSDIAQKSVEKTSISNMKKLFENFKMKD